VLLFSIAHVHQQCARDEESSRVRGSPVNVPEKPVVARAQSDKRGWTEDCSHQLVLAITNTQSTSMMFILL
jgi:hypothetical protein